MPRQYNSALRQAQAQQTRDAVLRAGRDLIVEQGYARTSMKAIAERAGIAVDTVYQHFRSKPALLKALLDLAVGGDEAPVPVTQRDWVKQITSQPDAAATLAAFASAVTAVHQRLAALFIAAAAAAAADEHAAELWNQRYTERLQGMHDFAQTLRRTGELAPNLTNNDIRDRLFTLASPEVYSLLVLNLGWPPDRYATWLTDLLTQQLLPRSTS
jgi:AcrR family transcriptional regulator